MVSMAGAGLRCASCASVPRFRRLKWVGCGSTGLAWGLVGLLGSTFSGHSPSRAISPKPPKPPQPNNPKPTDLAYFRNLATSAQPPTLFRPCINYAPLTTSPDEPPPRLHQSSRPLPRTTLHHTTANAGSAAGEGMAMPHCSSSAMLSDVIAREKHKKGTPLTCATLVTSPQATLLRE